MAFHLNAPRILADASHTASKLILITSIHRNKSAEGVSLLTQILYIAVFGTRYLDLFWVPPWWSWWNFVLKIFYIASSAYIVWLMMRCYARTREKEYAWKLATGGLAVSAVAAPVVCLTFRHWKGFGIAEILWTFSIILESICILPQLLLLRQTSVPTVIDSFYLITLGSYRFFYILNWIFRAATEGFYDPIAIIFGVIQTALYVDFAWVYYSRQRVKLRGGGVVDSDDLRKSFFVRRIIGQGSRADAEDDEIEEEEGVLGARVERPSGGARAGRSWGARGISVNADDTLAENQAKHGEAGRESGSAGASYEDTTTTGDAQMIDPAHFEDEDDEDAPPTYATREGSRKSSSSSSGGHGDDSQTAWAENTGESK